MDMSLPPGRRVGYEVAMASPMTVVTGLVMTVGGELTAMAGVVYNEYCVRPVCVVSFPDHIVVGSSRSERVARISKAVHYLSYPDRILTQGKLGRLVGGRNSDMSVKVEGQVGTGVLAGPKVHRRLYSTDALIDLCIRPVVKWAVGQNYSDRDLSDHETACIMESWRGVYCKVRLRD